ncbi:uncharacterized protein LOC133393724 [Anopheles gambiae]|uniref:uncharacterized protein LOC133393724 n=1 Tax=Anopheles gambiae TaxID=7165 RepID=UPI002AC8ED3B|nr:uncharacterized protein LOC133393724 [Anopheles gambiae]
MFDCFCSQPPVAGDTGEPNVPFETFPNHHQRPSVVATEFAAELVHQLVGGVRGGVRGYGPYLARYALLINAIETVLSMYALLTQAGWDHRLQWRPLFYIPKYLRINIALVVSLLTVYSNLAAIVGLLKHQPYLLLPYICLRLGTFVLELCYLVDKTSPRPACKLDPKVCPLERWRSWSPLMVVLVGCNLSAVIAVYMTDGGLKVGAA